MDNSSFSFHHNFNCEIVHYYEPEKNAVIKSSGRHFNVCLGHKEWSFSLPLSLSLVVFSLFRISRRLLRLDKSNAVFTYKKEAIVVLYRGNIWRYCLEDSSLTQVGVLKNFRNALHGGIAVTPRGIYVGEYGSNSERNSVSIINSSDNGYSWATIYTFPKGSIKHVHGVYFDSYTGRLWIPTGDFNGECFLISANYNFTDVIKYGDGTQKWRAVGLFFKEKEVVWGMDSPLEVSFIQRFDRKEGTLTKGVGFPGPVWYVKQLSDGVSLLQTSVEIGAGVSSNSSHVYASIDLENWHRVASFKKDFWPMPYFKWGVISFADGEQSSQDFAIFGEALDAFDGVAFAAKLNLKGVKE